MSHTNLPGQSPRWWVESKEDQYRFVFDNATRIWNDTGDRLERNVRCLRLYGNSDYVGAAPYSMSKSIAPSLPENRVKVNVVSSMVDTVAAKISKIRPRVSFLTEGGDAKSQEDAKNLSKFVEGLFYANKVHELHQLGFKDGNVFDIGALKHYREGDKIRTERVLANELLVDEVDGMYGRPQVLYQVKYIHKDVLKAAFPKRHAIIAESANTLTKYTANDSTSLKEYAIVVEAWHLPSGPDEGDGVHIICTDKGNLFHEEYKRDYFPFTFFRWSTRLVGFWGQSLSDRLTGNQIEINKMLRVIQKSFNLGASFKVFLEHGSKIAKEHLNNEIGGLVYYTGQKPEFYVPKTVHEEYFRHLEFLIQSSYEEAGISQLSASSRKPAGLDSGKALREYDDIETERFAIVSQDYERTFLETARQYVDLVKEMAEDGVDYEVVAQSKKFIEKLKWSDIEVEDNEFIMQAFPVSMLPHTPAGRIQFVEEMMNAGFIDKNFGLKLLDFPDVQAYSDLINAPLDNIIDTLTEILSKGNYLPPEPMQDLATGIKVFQSAYLRGRIDKVPQERMDLLLRWISQAEAMLQKAQQAQAAQQPAPPEGQAVMDPATGQPVHRS